jgi:hypothetical protein
MPEGERQRCQQEGKDPEVNKKIQIKIRIGIEKQQSKTKSLIIQYYF